MSKLTEAKTLIDSMDLEDLREVVNFIADRSCKLEGVAFGLEDVSLQMAQAMSAKEIKTCPCCQGTGNGAYPGERCFMCQGRQHCDCAQCRCSVST